MAYSNCTKYLAFTASELHYELTVIFRFWLKDGEW
jgi:hypothetical protein